MAKTLTQKIEELESEVEELEDKVQELNDEVEELKEQLENAQDDPDHDGTFTGMEEIKYITSGNLIDQQLMQTIGRALEIVSVLELMNELNTIIRINEDVEA